MSRITDHSDQCECAYHEECLEDLIPNAGDAFIYPKCRDTLDEVIHSRIIEQRLPPPWEQCSIPLWMLDPAVLPEPCARSLSDGGAYNPAQGGLRGYPERSDKIRDSMLRLANLHVGRYLDLD